MTIEEFGKTIKAKYPQYNDLPDADLGQRMLAKYPQYKDLVKGPPASPKADAFLAGHPVLKGISDFVGTTNLGKGIAQGIFLKFTPEGKNLLKLMGQGQVKQEEIEDIIGKAPTTKQIIGSALQTGLTALSAGSLPGAKIGKIPGLTKGVPFASTVSSALGGTGKVAQTAAKMAAGGSLGYGFDVANNLQTGKPTFKPGLGTGIGTSIPFASALIGNLTKKTVGVTSGVGKNVIQQALDDPNAVSKAASQYAKSPETKTELVEKAKMAIGDFLNSRNDTFGSAINSMKSAQPLYKEAVVNSFEKNVNRFRGQIKDGALVFGDTSLSKSDQNNLREAWDVISKWKDNTPKGFDTLRQAIGNLIDDFKVAGNTRANVILGQTKKELTEYISKNVSGYSDVLAKYGADSQVAREIFKELGLSANAKPSTQLNGVLRLFRKDKNVLRNLETALGKEQANKFLSEIAGAILSEWVPSGKVGNATRVLLGSGAVGSGLLAGNPSALTAAAAGAAMSSPRIVGKAATTIGKAAQSGITTGAGRIITSGASRTNP